MRCEQLTLSQDIWPTNFWPNDVFVISFKILLTYSELPSISFNKNYTKTIVPFIVCNL